MKKPLIGINLDVTDGPPPVVSVQSTYLDAIRKSGGIPVLLPPMSDEDLSEVLGRLNGIMLIGGPDYCPSKYGETTSPTVQLMNGDREEFDFKLALRSLQKDMPILGICAGCQLLNISLGGSLIQDIKTELPKSEVVHTARKNPWVDGFNRHEVVLSEGSYLRRIYNKPAISVPTSHHQAVRSVGKGLKITAHAEDGIVEAVELSGHPFILGVQWHPERDYEGNKVLFDEFVKQSSVHVAKSN